MDDLTVRPATPDDAVAIADLFTAARVAAVPQMPPALHTGAENRAWYAARLADGEHQAWAAEAEGELVGFALTTATWLDGIYVRPDVTGQGVGTVLLDLVKATHPDGIGLWVFETNQGARRLYERHGFVEMERTDGAENEEKAPDIRMAWPGPDAQAATVAAYDRFADAYAARTSGLTTRVAEQVGAFLATLPSPPRVLEVGSGSGRDALALEQAGAVVDRTDISAAFVDLLRRAGHQARVLDPLTGDVGGPFDGVWAQASLLHVARDDLGRLLGRLGDAVEPGGRLFLSLKEGDGESWSVHGSVAAPRHFTFWREGPLREVLTAAGWDVVTLNRHAEVRDTAESWLDVLAVRQSDRSAR